MAGSLCKGEGVTTEDRATDIGRWPITRRQLLAAGAATGFGALAAACGQSASPSASTVARSATVPPAGSDIGAVEHVIFLMMENRSFDHYYGTYPGVRGFDDHPAGDLGPFSQPWQAPGDTSASSRLLPFHLDTVHTEIADCTFDLTHAWGPQHQCRDDGKMDSFVRVHTSAANEGPTQGVLTMGYYTRADLPYYFTIADNYTICDGYHCSVMGPTHPNRLMQMSGTIDPAGKAGGPVIITNGSPDAIFSVHWDTMPEVLEDAGISWKCYGPGRQHLHHRHHAQDRAHDRQRHALLLAVREPVNAHPPEGVPARPSPTTSPPMSAPVSSPR